MTGTRRLLLGLAGGAAILGGAAFLAKRSPAVVHPPAAPAAIVTRQVGEGRWEVSRSDRDAYFSDPNRVNREILLRPVAGTEPDSITELRIARLSPDSPIHAAGLREGDRILRIDGATISRLSDAVNLVHRIRAASRLVVEVERTGQERRYEFEFR